MADFFEEFIKRYRKAFDFPSQATYEIMEKVLKAEKGVPIEGVPSWEKKNITDRYRFVQQNENDEGNIIHVATGRPVLLQENALEVLEIYHDQKGHGGRDGVIKNICEVYHMIPKELVEKYRKACAICATRNAIARPVVGQAIQATGVMNRLQADTIDVRSSATAGTKYILQVKDHFTKYVWAFAMESKDCKTVASHIRTIFLQFGPPHILQTDNGGEFVGRPMIDMLTEFPCVSHIQSRPRHPQSQGLVERANRTLTQRLGAWIQQNGRENWPSAIPLMAFEINRTYSRVIKTSLFELMFGRKVTEPTSAAIDNGEAGLGESDNEDNDGVERGAGIVGDASGADIGRVWQRAGSQQQGILHRSFARNHQLW